MESNLNWDSWEMVNYNSLNQTEKSIIPDHNPSEKETVISKQICSMREPTPFPDICDLPPLPLSPFLSPMIPLQSYVEAFEILSEDPFDDLMNFFQPTIIIISFCITNTLLWLNLEE